MSVAVSTMTHLLDWRRSRAGTPGPPPDTHDRRRNRTVLFGDGDRDGLRLAVLGLGQGNREDAVLVPSVGLRGIHLTGQHHRLDERALADALPDGGRVLW